ncbi:type I restriction-modification system subunit M N-terminal domain-containing protein [Ramlibacter aurantiacus]|uniref:type I restriction-modification system subunit M N-terminal domain-containing protein n=1 Tax=Ramlibacter aurantiacus TaxID=2801330 RepID=UPI00338DDD9B
MDAADFKTYIFPLLFFKRICDVWDEEYQEIVDENGDEQLAWFPESHRFQIPEDCHWNDVRTKASNVGAALQRAMREIEKANPDTCTELSAVALSRGVRGRAARIEVP